MRHVLVIAIFVFTIWSTAVCRPAGPTTETVATTSVDQELIDLEKTWNAAFLRKDLTTLKRIMSDDIVIVTATGRELPRPRTWQALERGSR